MNIQLIDVNKLVPYDRNPKRHPPDQVAAIAKSISSFGWDQPIVVDKDYVIVKGHGRRLAAIQLGMKEVPVIVREDMDERTAQLHRVLDNHIPSQEWAQGALRAELLELQAEGKLEFTLFKEDQIPVDGAFKLDVEATEFDLTTKHTCPSCEYAW